MRTDGHRVFNWLLVIALALMPLRTLNAAPVCHMHAGDSQGGMHAHQASDTDGHCMHPAGVMQHHAAGGADIRTHKRGCCCGHGMCASGCGMVHVSAIMRSAPLIEGHYLALPLTATGDSLLTRILTPPSRPPLRQTV